MSTKAGKVPALRQKPSQLRFRPADIFRAPKAEEDSRPPLALYRPQRNVKGMGAIVMVAGQAVNAYYDQLAALGLHPRKLKPADAPALASSHGPVDAGLSPAASRAPRDGGEWVFIAPASRYGESPLLRAQIRLLIAKACNWRTERQLEVEAELCRLRGDERRAIGLEAEAALRREKLNHKDTKAPSPEEKL